MAEIHVIQVMVMDIADIPDGGIDGDCLKTRNRLNKLSFGELNMLLAGYILVHNICYWLFDY